MPDWDLISKDVSEKRLAGATKDSQRELFVSIGGPQNQCPVTQSGPDATLDLLVLISNPKGKKSPACQRVMVLFLLKSFQQ